MKKNEIFRLLYRLASPIGIIVLGGILLLSPDTASALLSRLMGWCIFLVGVAAGISGIVSKRGTAGKILAAILCLGIGGALIRNPLMLAANIGRFLGILLLIRGGRDFFQSSQQGGKVLSLVTGVLGAVLVLVPMTTSRLVFSLCGLVILLVGVAMLITRLREQKYLDSGDSNIIDAL